MRTILLMKRSALVALFVSVLTGCHFAIARTFELSSQTDGVTVAATETTAATETAAAEQFDVFCKAVREVNLFDFFLDSEEVLQAGGTEMSKAYKQLIDLLPEGKKDKIAVLEFAGELIGKKDTGKLSTTDKHFLAIHHLLKKHGNTKAFYDYLLDLSNICNGEKDLTNDKIRVAGLPYYKRVETAGGIVFIPTATKIRIDNKSDAPFLVPEHLEGNVAVGGKSRMKTIREITTAKTNTEKNQLYNDFVKNGLVSDGQEFYVHVDGVKIELQLTLFEKNDLNKAKQRLGISQNEPPKPNVATDSVVPPVLLPVLSCEPTGDIMLNRSSVAKVSEKIPSRGDKTADAYLDELKKNNVSAEQVKGGGYRYYYTHSQSNQKVEITSALTDAQKTDLAGVVKYLATPDLDPKLIDSILSKCQQLSYDNDYVKAAIWAAKIGKNNEAAIKVMRVALQRANFGLPDNINYNVLANFLASENVNSNLDFNKPLLERAIESIRKKEDYVILTQDEKYLFNQTERFYLTIREGKRDSLKNPFK